MEGEMFKKSRLNPKAKRLNPRDWVKAKRTLDNYNPPLNPLETLKIESISNGIAHCDRVDRKDSYADIPCSDLELVETDEQYSEYVAAKMAGELD
jgi:hypothetical protein